MQASHSIWILKHVPGKTLSKLPKMRELSFQYLKFALILKVERKFTGAFFTFLEWLQAEWKKKTNLQTLNTSISKAIQMLHTSQQCLQGVPITSLTDADNTDMD